MPEMRKKYMYLIHAQTMESCGRVNTILLLYLVVNE